MLKSGNLSSLSFFSFPPSLIDIFVWLHYSGRNRGKCGFRFPGNMG